MYLFSSGFSKERSRISNRQKFLAYRRQLETERLSEKYVNWIDEAEHAAAHEAQEKCIQYHLSCLKNKYMFFSKKL